MAGSLWFGARWREAAPILKRQRAATGRPRLWFDDSGVSSVEYALLLAVAAASIIVAAATLSNSVQNEIIDAADCIKTNGATC